MKKTIYILMLLCFGFKPADKTCGLQNGKYKVVYDAEFSDHPKFEFEVNGEILTKVNSDTKRVFKLKKLYKNNFSLKPTETQTDSLTEFQKALTSHGKPYYDIVACKKDTLYFVMRVDLHIISQSGKFVRID
jgi:hypothetical protein